MAPMPLTAIVLCAGRGGRLRPLTDEVPKCLLPIGGRPILERCLGSLNALGIRDIVLVIGYRGEMIESLIRTLKIEGVRFVHNPDYERTNTAVSFRLALRGLDSDCVLINGDVVFERSILEDLLALPAGNGVVVDTDIPLNGEEVKVVSVGGRVDHIGKHLDPAVSLGEAIGLYKIERSIIPELVRIYETIEANGEPRHFFEIGFDRIVTGSSGSARSFGLTFTRGRPWVEIDTLEDYDHAERDIVPRFTD